MEKDIKFYYGLDVEIINNNKNCYLLLCEEEYYYYIKCERSEEELKDIIKICYELQNKKIRTNQIIYNIKNSYVTNGYVLVKIRYFLDDEMTLEEMLKYNQNLLIKNEYKNYWGELWSNKVDYLENKIKNLKDKKVILSSFDYYVGLAENAITMINRVNKKYVNETLLVLSRNRIKYPLYYKDFFNPLYFIFDTRIRDIAEYLKSKFFKGEDIKKDLDVILKEKFSVYEFNLLYIRMLYPSYYFDLVDSILINEIEEEEIISIIDKIEEYEEILRYMFNLFSKYCYVENASWLNKKE